MTNPSETEELLFSGLKVIDAGTWIAGPVAGTILADFGASVIKVEIPGAGDPYRALSAGPLSPQAPVNYMWMCDGRNKRSITLNLSEPEGREILMRLVRDCDVFITNQPFATRRKLRLNYEDLAPENERMIYASLTAYGEYGPDAELEGFDGVAWWARTGLMDRVRAPGATPGGSVPGMGDHPTAMSMYAAIVTALYKRQMTGEGGVVSTSLIANGLWSNSCQIQASLCDVPLPPRPPRGQRSPLGEMYLCKDGRWFILAIANAAREWPLLARAVGHPEWADDPLFATPLARMENAAALVALLEQRFATADWAHWRDTLTEAGITFGPIARIEDHAADEQVAANNFMPAFADRPQLRTIDSPFYLATEPKQPPRMAPEIGQHTRAILEECGLNADKVAALIAAQGG